MSQLTPLSTHNPPGHTPVLMVNSAATHESLTTAADHRLSAASDLLETVALSASGNSGLSGCDLHNVAWAAHLLTSDARDLLSASFDAHRREVLAASRQR